MQKVTKGKGDPDRHPGDPVPEIENLEDEDAAGRDAQTNLLSQLDLRLTEETGHQSPPFHHLVVGGRDTFPGPITQGGPRESLRGWSREPSKNGLTTEADGARGRNASQSGEGPAEETRGIAKEIEETFSECGKRRQRSSRARVALAQQPHYAKPQVYGCGVP